MATVKKSVRFDHDQLYVFEDKKAISALFATVCMSLVDLMNYLNYGSASQRHETSSLYRQVLSDNFDTDNCPLTMEVATMVDRLLAENMAKTEPEIVTPPITYSFDELKLLQYVDSSLAAPNLSAAPEINAYPMPSSSLNDSGSGSGSDTDQLVKTSVPGLLDLLNNSPIYPTPPGSPSSSTSYDEDNSTTVPSPSYSSPLDSVSSSSEDEPFEQVTSGPKPVVVTNQDTNQSMAAKSKPLTFNLNETSMLWPPLSDRLEELTTMNTLSMDIPPPADHHLTTASDTDTPGDHRTEKIRPTWTITTTTSKRSRTTFIGPSVRFVGVRYHNLFYDSE